MMTANNTPQSTPTIRQDPKNIPGKKPKRIPSWLRYVLGLVGLVYLLNPTAGILELIPDILPYVGNLDEGAATVLLWTGAQEFLAQRCIRKQVALNKLP